VPESEGLTLDSTAPDSPADGKSKSMNTAAGSSLATGPKSRSSAISENSQEMNSNPSNSLRADTPANPSAKPESELEPTTPGIFGPSLPVSFGYYDPDTCSWKTSQATFHWDSGMYLETWPDSGTMRNGCVYERPISERPTFESASSSWPATRATSGGGNTSAYPNAPYRPALAQLAQKWPTARGKDGESAGNHPGAMDSLTGVTRTWSTPQAHQGGGNSQRDVRGSGGPDLKEQTEHWATPDANRSSYSNGVMGPNIREQASQWQTPATDSFRSRGGDRVDEMGLDQQARMHWATPQAHERAQDPRQVDHGAQLANQVDSWQTPQARDHRSGASLKDYGNTRPLNEQVDKWLTPHAARAHDSDNSDSTYLARQVHSLQGPKIPDGPQSSENGPTSPLRLNPQFVEWLMGFPIGWSKR
jgi:hypothetical protein